MRVFDKKFSPNPQNPLSSALYLAPQPYFKICQFPFINIIMHESRVICKSSKKSASFILTSYNMLRKIFSILFKLSLDSYSISLILPAHSKFTCRYSVLLLAHPFLCNIQRCSFLVLMHHIKFVSLISNNLNYQ